MRRLLPRTLSNAFHGPWLALILLVPVLIVKTVIGFNFSGLNPLVDVGQILQTVDGVPLDTFTPDARSAVISASQAWGAALFALCLFVWIALIRYREAMPLATLLLLTEQLIRTGAAPVRAAFEAITGGAALHAGAMINLGMTLLLAAAFGLSLMVVRRRN